MSFVTPLLKGLNALTHHPRRAVVGGYRWFRRRSRKIQLGLVFLVVATIIALILFGGNATKQPVATPLPAVTLADLATLAGSAEGAQVFGTVRSVSEATVLSETGGSVRAVHASLGSSVGSGYIIAELENASERAAVLSAEGSYEVALASRSSVGTDLTTAVRNAYRNAFIQMDTTLENDVDTFFGAPTAEGPRLLITAPGSLYQRIPNMRRDLNTLMTAWRNNIDEAQTANPITLFTEAETAVQAASTLLIDLARAANDRDSGASESQLASLAAARASVDGLLTSLSQTRDAYEASTGASIATSASDAVVKQALGALRLAQANLEKTLIRAPIGGTVNFLPIRTGDYVTAFTHVATVANNGTLEIVANVSEENRNVLSIGSSVLVEDLYTARVTSISPALNPQTKQIEVRLAVTAASELTNGASVRVALPASTATAEMTGVIALPLTSVKLLPDTRVIFTVDEEDRLVAIPVETGVVRGSRIEILSALDPAVRIVVDARGRSAGEKVRVAGSE